MATKVGDHSEEKVGATKVESSAGIIVSRSGRESA